MMTYEDELREEHQHELDQQVMDHELDAITYSERENANLHRAVERLERDNKKLVAVLKQVKMDIEFESLGLGDLKKQIKRALALEGE